MAEADWASLTGAGLGTGDVIYGVSAGFTPPPASGANVFVFGFKALTSAAGAAGLYVNLANFIPFTGTRKGGRISVAMKRYSSGVLYSPFIALLKGTDPASAEGYILGLEAAASYHIILRKGGLGSLLSQSESTALRVSTDAFTEDGSGVDAWKHLQLNVLVNPHGESIIYVKQNDLSAHDVDAPTWEDIDGMDPFVDDPMGILSGSVPHEDGFYAVKGMIVSAGVGSCCLFDQVVVGRQNNP